MRRLQSHRIAAASVRVGHGVGCFFLRITTSSCHTPLLQPRRLYNTCREVVYTVCVYLSASLRMLHLAWGCAGSRRTTRSLLFGTLHTSPLELFVVIIQIRFCLLPYKVMDRGKEPRLRPVDANCINPRGAPPWDEMERYAPLSYPNLLVIL